MAKQTKKLVEARDAIMNLMTDVRENYPDYGIEFEELDMFLDAQMVAFRAIVDLLDELTND